MVVIMIVVIGASGSVSQCFCDARLPEAFYEELKGRGMSMNTPLELSPPNGSYQTHQKRIPEIFQEASFHGLRLALRGGLYYVYSGKDRRPGFESWWAVLPHSKDVFVWFIFVTER